MTSKQTDYANMMNANREPPKGDMHLWTMRDEFAKAAMQGFAADPNTGSSPKEWIARIAYEWADAMMQAREVRNDET